MPPMYYDDFSLGQKFVSKGRTITEADLVNFAGFSGDFNPLHTDEVFARKTPFGRRIAHGVGILAITTGLNQSLGIFEGSIIAFLGLEWDFLKPVFIGDTIRLVITVDFKRETMHPDRGIIFFDAEVLNQNDEVVQKGKRKIMILRKSEEV